MKTDDHQVVGHVALDVLDDVHLLELARAGRSDAYAELFSRYRHAATRLARHLAPTADADDIVAETFTQVLDQISRGKGPDRAFRAYLFTSIRHEAGRRARQRKRVTPTDDLATIDRAVPFGAGQLDSFEKELVREAYVSLPDRWQTVLWYLDVEGLKPHELSERMDLKPNSVSALVYRARAGLREAYLAQHVAVESSELADACRAIRPRLGGLVRRTVGMREQKRLHVHLESCQDCMNSYLEVQDVNARVVAQPAAGQGVAGVTSIARGLLVSLVPMATAAAVVAVLGVSASATLLAVDDHGAATESVRSSLVERGDSPERPQERAARDVATTDTAVRSDSETDATGTTSPVVARAASAVPPAPAAAAQPDGQQAAAPTLVATVAEPLERTVVEPVVRAVVEPVVATVPRALTSTTKLLRTTVTSSTALVDTATGD